MTDQTTSATARPPLQLNKRERLVLEFEKAIRQDQDGILSVAVLPYEYARAALLTHIAALEDENAHLMHASEEVMAENVRLQQRVEELEKAARPPLVPKIDPDLGW